MLRLALPPESELYRARAALARAGAVALAWASLTISLPLVPFPFDASVLHWTITALSALAVVLLLLPIASSRLISRVMGIEATVPDLPSSDFSRAMHVWPSAAPVMLVLPPTRLVVGRFSLAWQKVFVEESAAVRVSIVGKGGKSTVIETPQQMIELPPGRYSIQLDYSGASGRFAFSRELIALSYRWLLAFHKPDTVVAARYDEILLPLEIREPQFLGRFLTDIAGSVDIEDDAGKVVQSINLASAGGFVHAGRVNVIRVRVDIAQGVYRLVLRVRTLALYGDLELALVVTEPYGFGR